MVKIAKCMHCGNVVEFLEDKGVPVVCCGEPMKVLSPNTTDAATEKHVPVVEVEGNKVTVKVGSVPHPMTEEHYIGFIILETSFGLHKKYLDHTGVAEATFVIGDDEKVVAAYEYCNLHGFWMKEM